MIQSANTNKNNAFLDPRGEGAPAAWSAAIDELPGSQDWVFEIESPQVYLTFRVVEISALARAVDLLNSASVARLQGRKYAFVPNRDDVALGHFGEGTVHLLRDNEDFSRCFLVIEQQSVSTLRLSLAEGDIWALADAIKHAIADFSRAGEGPQQFWDYQVLGGSHDGLTMRFSQEIKSGSTLPIQMRGPGPPTDMRPDPDGRMELYQLEPDGKLYFLNVFIKDGKQITSPGTHEPSRIFNDIKYFDYRFVGGSHDGNNMSLPHDFEDGFCMALDMRSQHGPHPSGKQEVYKLEADRRFHYQHAVMKDGKQIAPSPKAPQP